MKITLLPAAEQDVAEAAEFRRVAHVLLEFPAIGSPRSRGR